MKISIAILCYNYGRFLSRAIESALAQHNVSDAELEILVIDDGSTDETPDVCARYGTGIRVHRSANEGFGASLTKAIRYASGDYICLLDADDYFAPDKLATLLPEIRKGMLYIDHWQWWVDADDHLIDGPCHGGNTSTICVNRIAALDLLPIENEVSFQIILRAGYGVRLSQPLGYYRKHNSSMTDRNRPGVQNDYLAGVHHRVAARLRQLSPLPQCISSTREARRLAYHYEALGYYNELEAALERHQRIASWVACCRMLSTAVRSKRGVSGLNVRMVAKTILSRPSFPKKG
ncbi:glycosyltransferase family 2 protein [Paraburkholderia sp. GAS348]|uniref:glycosyltransferase family 2 protein n=1 Tax=Paraburkholderia sp. GAS348 TaxID=3035132 RepID=UPI003D234DC3